MSFLLVLILIYLFFFILAALILLAVVPKSVPLACKNEEMAGIREDAENSFEENGKNKPGKPGTIHLVGFPRYSKG